MYGEFEEPKAVYDAAPVPVQSDADRLLALEKERVSETEYVYPQAGSFLEIPIRSTDKWENFKLTIRPGKFTLEKVTDQLREKSSNVVLARVDVGNVSHTNPDGEVISGSHLHLYREGYGDKFAVPLPDLFANADNPYLVLGAFMQYCNIRKIPKINRVL